MLADIALSITGVALAGLALWGTTRLYVTVRDRRR